MHLRFTEGFNHMEAIGDLSKTVSGGAVGRKSFTGMDSGENRKIEIGASDCRQPFQGVQQ